MLGPASIRKLTNRVSRLLNDLLEWPDTPVSVYNTRSYLPLLTAASISIKTAEEIGTNDLNACQDWLELLSRCLITFNSYGPPPSMPDKQVLELKVMLDEIRSRAQKLSEAIMLFRSQAYAAKLGPVHSPIREIIAQHAEGQNGSPSDALLERADNIARLSEAKFATICSRFDWKLIPTPLESDYGIDFRVEIPEQPGRTSRDVEFLVQLKGSNQRPDKRGRLRVSIRCDTVDYWNSKLLPVLVLLYHQPTDRFYCVWHTAEPCPGKTRSYFFSSENEIDSGKVSLHVKNYYNLSKAALTSRGALSVFSRILASSAGLLAILLANEDVRRAMVNVTDVSAKAFDHMFITVLVAGISSLEAGLRQSHFCCSQVRGEA